MRSARLESITFTHVAYESDLFAYTGIPIMVRAQTSHPLDPLSAAEISVAVATVRAAGATPEVNRIFVFVNTNYA